MKLTTIIASMLAASTAFAQEVSSSSPWHLSATASYASKQMWKGTELHDTPVHRYEVVAVRGDTAIIVAQNYGQGYDLKDATIAHDFHIDGLTVSAGLSYFHWDDSNFGFYKTVETTVSAQHERLPISAHYTHDRETGDHLRVQYSRAFQSGIIVDIAADWGRGFNDDNKGYRHTVATASYGKQFKRFDVGGKGYGLNFGAHATAYFLPGAGQEKQNEVGISISLNKL